VLGFVSLALRASVANAIFSIVHLPSSKTEDWPNAGMWKCAWIGVKEGPNQQSAILAIFHPQWRKIGPTPACGSVPGSE
jgi:hypothetical protein